MSTNDHRWWKLICWLIGAVVVLLGARPSTLSAQESCTEVIAALRTALEKCGELNSNYACYGQTTSWALPASERFIRPGDRLPVTVLRSVRTERPNGAAFLRISVGDQTGPLDVVLYGGIELNPLGKNVFILRYANNAPLCADTSPGLVVQTAEGEIGRITVNGIEIEMESTAFIAMPSAEVLTVANIAGKVTVNVPNLGVRQPLPTGQQVPITQRNGVPVAVGELSPSPAVNSSVIQWLAQDDNGLRRISDPNTEPHPTIPPCGGQLAYGQAINGQNFTPGQECLFTFNGTAGDVVTINLANTNSSLNPWVDLRGPDGRLLKANDNMSETDQDSLVCNRALPVTGLYTIVARARHNESAGSFTLTLHRATTCTPPPPHCEVGLNGVVMRTRPTSDDAVAQTLAPGARFRPLARLTGGRWLQIALLPNGEQGWINVSPYEILCDTNLDELPAGETPSPAEAVITPSPPAPPACFKVQPANWCAYRVRAGDTLTDIARRSNATLGRLREVNCKVFSDVIQIGEILFVPCPPPTRTPTPTPLTCAPLSITSLNHDLTSAGILVVWQATGGCDPIQGQLSFASELGDGSLPVAGRTGSQLLPYPHVQYLRSAAARQCEPSKGGTVPCPPDPMCAYTLRYTLVLNDSSNQRTQQSGSVSISYPCPVIQPG
jgi:LysM domain